MAKASANTLIKCAAALDHALEQRDGWIAAMRDDGHSLREIARSAQLTPEGVQHVLRRSRNQRAERTPSDNCSDGPRRHTISRSNARISCSHYASSSRSDNSRSSVDSRERLCDIS